MLSDFVFDEPETLNLYTAALVSVLLFLTPLCCQAADEESSLAVPLNIGPVNAYSYFERGLAYADKKQYDKAIQAFSNAIGLSPYYVRAYIERGRAYAAEEQYEKALVDLNRALRLEPRNSDASALRTFIKEQEEKAEKAKIIEPEYAGVYIERGVAYIEKGQHDKGIQHFSRVIKLEPNNADAYVLRGIAYSEIEQYDKAISDLSRAIELEPGNAYAYFSRGMGFYYLKSFQSSLKDLNRSIELNSKDANVYLLRGTLMARMGQAGAGLDDFQKSELIKGQKDYQYYYGLAGFYAILKDAPKACECLSKSIAEGYKGFGSIKKDFDFDNIRNEPCYLQIIKDS